MVGITYVGVYQALLYTKYISCGPYGYGIDDFFKFFSNYKSKEGCQDQESIHSNTTPDPGYQWESDKLTVRHHKREPRGQPFPSR